MVSLTIDGRPVAVPEGTTVLEAAQAAGVPIPTLCNHPSLKPFGGCRLCLVEVEGARSLQPSCTLPVSEKMVVLTNTEKIKTARKFVLTLIFSDRNHFCPYCHVTGADCELQNAALDEGMSHWPYPPAWQKYPVDASHPYYVMDHNRCILCHRCIRACGQLVGNFTLGVEERGASSMLTADSGLPLGESSCVSCGTCVAVCPTGALIERRSAYQGLNEQLTQTQSICTGCSVGCGVSVYTRDNRLVRILGDWDAAINGGVLCKTGRFLPLEENRERITTPMVKKNGSLQPATWNEALEVLAARLKPLSGKNGDGVAALASTYMPVEALTLFKQIFSDHLGSEMVTSIEEGRTTAIASALAEELGHPFEGDLNALKISDCVLVVGADLAESHMVAGFLVKRNLPNGTNLIVIDPRENGLDKNANLVMKAARGSDQDVLRGIQAGLVKLALVKTATVADAKAMVSAEVELAQAAQTTGISADDILAAAGMLGIAERPVIIYGKGITIQDSIQAMRQLLVLSQQAGAALLSMKGNANSLAAAQLRLEKPFQMNGHQAVFVAMADEYPSQRLNQRVEKAPFLAVQASYASSLSAAADVVLPVGNWAEQEGHYLNLDGHLQKANRILTAPEGVPSNADALRALAQKLDLQPDENWKAAIGSRPAPVQIISIDNAA